MSATGVPSIASIGPTLIRFPTISRTVTRCNPNGFGLSGDRVEKTPASGELRSLRGMDFQGISVRFLKPGNDYNLVTRGDVLESLGKTRADFEPRIGSSFRTLPRRILQTFQIRADETDRQNRVRFRRIHEFCFILQHENWFRIVVSSIQMRLRSMRRFVHLHTTATRPLVISASR